MGPFSPRQAASSMFSTDQTMCGTSSSRCQLPKHNIRPWPWQVKKKTKNSRETLNCPSPRVCWPISMSCYSLCWADVISRSLGAGSKKIHVTRDLCCTGTRFLRVHTCKSIFVSTCVYQDGAQWPTAVPHVINCVCYRPRCFLRGSPEKQTQHKMLHICCWRWRWGFLKANPPSVCFIQPQLKSRHCLLNSPHVLISAF